MSTKVQDLAYLVRCYNHTSSMIRSFGHNPRLTPRQAARLERLKRVRCALARDIQQAQQAIGAGVQLTYEPTLEQSEAAYHWMVRQVVAYSREGRNDPLKGRVESVSALSGEGR